MERHARLQCEGVIERIVREEGLTVLGWRDTPIDGTAIGRVARGSQPYIQQIFIARAKGMHEDQLERKLYVVRKRAETEIGASSIADKGFFYIPSLSARTIVYKGLLLAPQIANFYPELSDPEVVSALCLVHQRFSTNTFPTWQLAHPVPLHRPQRRNQYAARQRELDARAPDRFWPRRCSATTSRSCSPSSSPTAAIRRPSTTPWSCWSCPAAASLTPWPC